MPEARKRLGTTTATSAAALHDNGATSGTDTVVSVITVCNTSTTTAYTATISTSAAGATTHGAYLVSGVTVAASDTLHVGQGVILDPTNRYLVGHASNAAVVITAYGAVNT